LGSKRWAARKREREIERDWGIFGTFYRKKDTKEKHVSLPSFYLSLS
jgi:hypothetical protein